MAEDYNDEQKKIAYVCSVCQEMFKDAGMCPNCDAVLKKKGE